MRKQCDIIVLLKQEKYQIDIILWNLTYGDLLKIVVRQEKFNGSCKNINSLKIILMTKKFKSKCCFLSSAVLFLIITHLNQKDFKLLQCSWSKSLFGNNFLFIGLENRPCGSPTSLNDRNSSLEIPERVCAALDN